MASTQDYTSRGRGEPRRFDNETADLRRQAADLKEEAVARGQDELEQGKQAAAAQAEEVAGAVRQTARQLEDDDSSLAGYALQLSRTLQNVADNLKSRSVNDVAADLAAMARRNPTTFVLASVGVGLALGRFMKASGGRAADRPVQRAAESTTSKSTTSETDTVEPYGTPPIVHGIDEPSGDSPTQFSGA